MAGTALKMVSKVLLVISILTISSTEMHAADYPETKPKIETWLQELEGSSPNWERDLEGWKNSPNWIRHKRADVPTTPQFANPLVKAWLKEIQTSPEGAKDYEGWKNSPNFMRHKRADVPTQFTDPAEAWLKKIQSSPNWKKDLEGWTYSPNLVKHKRSEEPSTLPLSNAAVETWLKQAQSSFYEKQKDLEGWKNAPNWIRNR